MKPYISVSLGYFAFGAIWILTSDHVVALTADNPQDLSYFQTFKGLVYVGLSTLLIYGLTRHAFHRQSVLHQEKEAIFRKTMEGTHHILLNYLNQMQLVTMEAEKCPGFEPRILQLAQTATNQAEVELKLLNNIEQITAEGIDSLVYRGIRNT